MYVLNGTCGMAITESVDSVCRDGTDMPYVAIQTECIVLGSLFISVLHLTYTMAMMEMPSLVSKCRKLLSVFYHYERKRVGTFM